MSKETDRKKILLRLLREKQEISNEIAELMRKSKELTEVIKFVEREE